MWKPGRPRIGLHKPAQAAGAACGTAAAAVKNASLLEILLRQPWILPGTAAEREAAPAEEESPYSNSDRTAVALPDAALQLRTSSCSSDDQRSQQHNSPAEAPASAKAPANKPQLRSMPKMKTCITEPHVTEPHNADSNEQLQLQQQQQEQQQEHCAEDAAATISLPQATASAPKISSPADQHEPCHDSIMPDEKQAEQQLQQLGLSVLAGTEEQLCGDDWTPPYTTTAWTEGQVLGGRFRILNRLDSGGFATVYRAEDVYKNKEVAVKVTKHDQSDGDGLLPPDVKDDFKYVSLGREYANFMALSAGQPSRSATTPLPLVFDFERTWQMPLGPRTSDGYQLYSYMTMELGGPSMYWLGTSGTYKKDPALFVKHATSMLQGLQWMHSKGWVHNDVKSANFIASARSGQPGRSNAPPVFVIDLGFAKRTAGVDFNCPVDDAADIFSGTPDYSSTRCLQGFPCAPCDDLTALAFCLLGMATGSLPWDLTRHAASADWLKHEKLLRMAEQKKEILQQKFKEGKLPAFFGEFYTYITSLQPSDNIDYSYLQQLIQQAPSTSKPWCSRKRPAEDLQTAAAAAVDGASEQQPSGTCQQPEHAVPEQAEVQAPASKRIKAAELELEPEPEAGTTAASDAEPMQLPQEEAMPAAAEELQLPAQQLEAALEADAAAEMLPDAPAAACLPEVVKQQSQDVPMCEE